MADDEMLHADESYPECILLSAEHNNIIMAEIFFTGLQKIAIVASL